MADKKSGSGSLLLSALTGAALGAAGLSWWLLARAERRQALSQRIRQLGLQSQADGQNGSLGGNTSGESLEDRVQRLNLAIEDVRRQLEDFTPESNA